jgi:hypothetical protein
MFVITENIIKRPVRSGDYAVLYSGGERAERGVVHERILRSVVKKNVYKNIIVAVSSWMTLRKIKDTGN